MEQSNPCSRLLQLRGKCLILKIRTSKYKNNHFLLILTDSLPVQQDNGIKEQWDQETMGPWDYGTTIACATNAKIKLM
jgi:hypothetical protein